ncbi:unnamed protein product [Danaus chrysippus]|uniref:(African queen) hypothetical protein n=1 Tax=Danaus chrysippus TaxID=151541 RepID=A0A8J2W9L5_9NEOP|nr:unnamed protein product [Danaus chrysippus]
MTVSGEAGARDLGPGDGGRERCNPSPWQPPPPNQLQKYENARRHYTHSESEEKMNSRGNIDEMSFKHIMKFIIEQERRRREQTLTYMKLFEAEPLERHISRR